MATVPGAQRNPVPRGLAIAHVLLAVGALAPAAVLADPGYDDASYGDISQATFGVAAAAPAIAEGASASRDDASYGDAGHATFAVELATPDEAIARAGHDDVVYPSAEPRRTAEAAVASGGVPEGAEARTAGGSRVAVAPAAPAR